MEIFFLNFFKSLFDFILLQMNTTSKKIEKNDKNQLLHKIGAKHDFSIFRKKVEKSHFFSFLETQNRCLTKNVSFVKKMWRFFFLNFLNHFLTSFCFKWTQLQKNLKKMIQINFYTKFEQNTTFHVFEKKSKKVTFFHFSKLKIDVWLKMSVLSRKCGDFFS